MFCTTLLKLRDIADGVITAEDLRAAAESVEVPQNDEFGECLPWVLRLVEKLGHEGRLNVRDVDALGKEFEEFAEGNKAFARRTEPTLFTPSMPLEPSVTSRQRYFMAAVNVPHVESVLRKWTKAAAKRHEYSEGLLKHLNNPKVVKNENLSLSLDTVRALLEPIGLDLFPIPIDKDVTDATFSREFLSHLYGGNLRATNPAIAPKRVAEHGLDDFMYPNFEYSPQMPVVPGAPGLWYTVG
ncbi:hypothetical protein DXG03_003572 [Asterophora parasitica]|uniref:DUF6697 domain-containing protein n=1 Tax=Asterophora parasitica TaxID=117018 RepID=A0A9P7G7K3_9AGAR|nr:hypothetical protein DXG03_003572 [Asterophora parasitica]